MGVHLTGVHLIGAYLTGVYLTGVHPIGVYLMGVSTSEGSDAVKVGSRLSMAARSAAGAGSVVDAYDLMLTTRGEILLFSRATVVIQISCCVTRRILRINERIILKPAVGVLGVVPSCNTGRKGNGSAEGGVSREPVQG
jgi:hypothetical protein